jgi:isochorismate hydrolase
MAEKTCRSPLLLSAADSVLLLVDAQERLLSLIPRHSSMLWNLQRLGEAARVLNVPCLATEQYPEKLGPTALALQPYLLDHPAQSSVPAKLTFSCAGCEPCWESLQQVGRRQVVIGGLETHVCVLQTAFDLMTEGFDVFLAVDGLGARSTVDHRIALRRMEASGMTLTTTEGVLFEWCERAGTAEFKQISQIVRWPPPDAKDE